MGGGERRGKMAEIAFNDQAVQLDPIEELTVYPGLQHIKFKMAHI